jgi:hypothetical protein
MTKGMELRKKARPRSGAQPLHGAGANRVLHHRPHHAAWDSRAAGSAGAE